MRCVLGFDGGGTKTECVLMDETGRVLSRGRSGPSNPFRVGVESASEALQSAARDASQTGGCAITEVAAVVAGLAGTTRHDLAERMRAELSRLFPGSAVKLCTDFELALEAVGESPAIVLVAGTGSAAIGRDAAKDLAALVRRLIERLALGDVPFILAKTGGMIGRRPIFDEALDVALREGAPRASIISLSVAPAEAAARLALELLAPPKSAE